MRKRRRGKSVLHFFKVVWERLVKFGKVKKLKITVAAFEKQDFLSRAEVTGDIELAYYFFKQTQ